MKTLIASIALLLICAAAQADIPLQDTQCGTLAQCANPAPGMDYLDYSVLHGRLIVSINGVTYDSGLNNATLEGGAVYAANGQSHMVTTVFATWRTCTRSGRGQTCLTHYELKSGSVQ